MPACATALTNILAGRVKAGAHFDPETIGVLDAALNAAWASLQPHQQNEISRLALADRILKAAARGERNSLRLRAAALNGIEVEAQSAAG